MFQTGTAEFVRRFSEVWAAPTVEDLVALTHPDATFEQPLATAAHGHAAIANLFDELLQTLPDLTGEVEKVAEAEDGTLFVELRLTGTFGRRPVEWVTVDRFELADGLITRRVAYFDGLRLVGDLARRPRGWARWVKAKLDR